MWLSLAFAVAAIPFANVYPFPSGSDTEVLTALHLPIALWLPVGIAYAAGRWRETAGRMDFVRFSGELLIYYALIALGGGVVLGLTAGMFGAIGIDLSRSSISCRPPCAILGAVIVSSWLVEAKQSVIENMAPVLTRIFTPLFALALIAFLVTMIGTGRGIDIEREALIVFDLVLVLVLGLLLYSISARDAEARPDAFDRVLVVLLVSALVADAFALVAIGARISEFGFTPNRVAALGENVILLCNLGWSTVLYLRFLRGRGSFVQPRALADGVPACLFRLGRLRCGGLPPVIRIQLRRLISRNAGTELLRRRCLWRDRKLASTIVLRGQSSLRAPSDPRRWYGYFRAALSAGRCSGAGGNVECNERAAFDSRIGAAAACVARPWEVGWEPNRRDRATSHSSLTSRGKTRRRRPCSHGPSQEGGRGRGPDGLS